MALHRSVDTFVNIMKKLIFIIPFLALVFLTSCNGAKFTRYPGAKLDSIPVEFRGVYKDPDKKSKKKDFIVVGKDYYTLSDVEKKVYLSDSMVFSIYKGAYYLSTLEDNNKYWQILFVKPSGKDLHLYPMLYDEKLPDAKNSITKYFTPRVDKDSNYVFTMDEEKLFQYSQKELMKEEAMKLKRR